MAIQIPDPNNPGQFLEYTGPDFSDFNFDPNSAFFQLLSGGDKYEQRQTEQEKMLGLAGRLYDKETGELAPEEIQRASQSLQYGIQTGGADIREGTSEEIRQQMGADAAAAYDRQRAAEEANKLKNFQRIGQLADLVTGGTGIGSALGTAVGGGDLGDALKAGITSRAIAAAGAGALEGAGATGASQLIKSPVDVLKGVGKALTPNLGISGQAASSSFLDPIRGAISGVGDVLGGAVSGVGAAFGIDEAAKELGDKAKGKIKEEIERAKKKAPEQLKEIGKDMEDKVKEKIRGEADTFTDMGMGGIGGLLTGGAGLLALKELLGEKSRSNCCRWRV